MGISYAEFWHMNPRILDCYTKAYTIKRKEEDAMNWYLGQYFASAIGTCFDKHNKYPEHPFLQDLGLSEEEIADREIRKMIEIERQWSQNAKLNNLKAIEV